MTKSRDHLQEVDQLASLDSAEFGPERHVAFAESLAAGGDGSLTKPVGREVKPSARPEEALSEEIAARRPVFLENRSLDLSNMKNALLAKDFAAIQRIGHNCKGIGKGYGFPEIGTAGSNVECAARACNFPEVEKSIAEFEKCIKAT